MATWDDVRRLAIAMPEVAESDRRWRVRDKLFVWERPLRRTDLEALGPAAPTGDVLGAMVPDLGAKAALIAALPAVYFTTPHFDNYAAVLVRLDAIGLDELEELIGEAWLSRAPKRLAASYLAERER